jgi:hypothetical protein
MRRILAIMVATAIGSPAWAQTQQPAQTTTLVVSPFQALANVLRNPDAPPPSPPPTVTSEPLRLPTAIPPNTVGQNPAR